MDWAMMGGFVALAALTAGLLRDFKRDTRRQLDDSRAESREAYAQMNQRIYDLRTEFREAHKGLRTEFREAHAQTNQRIDDMRAETREAHAQTNQRINDLRAETREAHAQTNQRIDDMRAETRGSACANGQTDRRSPRNRGCHRPARSGRTGRQLPGGPRKQAPRSAGCGRRTQALTHAGARITRACGSV